MPISSLLSSILLISFSAKRNKFSLRIGSASSLKSSEEKKIVIDNDGELYLVFKDKVCAMKLSANAGRSRPEPMKVSGDKSDSGY